MAGFEDHPDPVSDAVDKVLDKIFSLDPVEVSPHYVVSALAQARLTTLPSKRSLVLEHHERNLPDWVGRPELLGPYERSLLSTVVSSPGGAIVFKAGTGSGKSSTFRYLRNHLAEHKIGGEYATPIALLDLQQVDDRLKHGNDDGGLSKADQVSLLLLAVSERLEVALETGVSPDLFGSVIAKALDSETSAGSTIGIFEVAAKTARDQLRRLHSDWESLRGKSLSEALTEVSKGMEPRERLGLWLLIAAELARHEAEQDRCVVAVLDNMDPLRAKLQDDLLHVLAALAKQSRWGSLKLVLPVRLTTFRRVISDVHFLAYEHECPDIVELVHIRLITFLLAPHGHQVFKQWSPKVQGSVLARLVEFWCHLADRGGHMADMLRALSGTNLRNGLTYAHRWCLSDRLRSGQLASGVLDGLQDFVADVIAPYVLETSAEAVGRAMAQRISDGEIRLLHLSKSPDLLSDQIVEGLCRSIADILDETLSTQHYEKRTHDPRSTFLHTATNSVLGLLQQETDTTDGVGLLRYRLEVSNLLNTLQRGHENSLDFSELFGGVASQLEADAEGPPPEFERAALRWAACGIRLATKRPITTGQWRIERRQPISLEESQIQGFLHSYQTRNSRYVAERCLLEPDGPSAVNVFGADRADLCPVPLHTLYLLFHTEGGSMATRDLLMGLRSYGYDDDDIDFALSCMVNSDTRLIYSGVTDEFDGIAEWFKTKTREVSLSSAGRAYVTTLMAAPSYVQWALSTNDTVATRVRADDTDSILGRLEAALRGLKVVVEEEFEQLRRMRLAGTITGWSFPPGMPCGNASADVFFRSLGSFVSVLSYTKRINREWADALSTEFIAFGEKVLGDVADTCGIDTHQPWEEELAFARKC